MKKILISLFVLFVIVFAGVGIVAPGEASALCPAGKECLELTRPGALSLPLSPAGEAGGYRATCSSSDQLCKEAGYDGVVCSSAYWAKNSWSSPSDNYQKDYANGQWVTYGASSGDKDYWTLATCERPIPPPSGSISASCGTSSSPCVIPLGGSSTSVSLTWSVTNPQGGSSINGTSVSNSGSQSFTPSNASDTVYSLVNNGQNLDSVGPIIVACASGSNWNGSSCQAPAPTCSSSSPQSSSTTATSGTFYVYAYGVSSSVTSVSFPTWGDPGGQDDIVWYTGSNQGGGTWRAGINLGSHKSGNPEYGGFSVHIYMDSPGHNDVFCGTANFSRPALVMSGTLSSSSSSCIIPSGGNSCNVNLTWTTTNPVGTSAVTGNNPDNTTIANGNNGTNVSVTVPATGRSYYLYNNSQQLAGPVSVTVSCISGTTWNGSTCAPNAPTTYTVSTSAGSGGTISPTSRTVNSGSTTTFTITPNSGYTASASGCSGSLSGTTYTTGAITANCTVAASFSLNPTPNLTASAPSPSTASVNAAQTYTATISNTGNASTVNSFSNFWQRATSSNGSGTVTDLASSSMSALNAGASATSTSPSITFTGAGTYSVRVCADKSYSGSSGSISESNENDNCSAWTNVTVSNPPAGLPVVTSPTHTSITSNSATLGGNVTSNGGSALTERGVCWSVSPSTTASDACNLATGTSTGVFTKNVTGLNSGSLHYYKAFARNSAGYGFSPISSFTTTSATTIPTVTTSGVTSITQTTASGGGNTTSNGGATVTQAGLVWSTSANPTTSSNMGITYNGWAVGGPWASSMTGLSSGTTYHVRAYATNSVGTAYGADVPFTTTSATPVPVVTISANPTSGTVNSVNPSLTWSATNSPTSCNASGDWSGSKPTSGTNVSQGVLTTARTYTYTLTCSNSGGTSAPASATVVATSSGGGSGCTATTPVSGPLSLSLSGSGNRTANLSWNYNAGTCAHFWSGGSGTPSYPSTFASGNYTQSLPNDGSFGWTLFCGPYGWTNPTAQYAVTATCTPATTVPSVTTNSVSNISQTAATGGGNVTSNGGATLTGKGIVYSTTANPTISNGTNISSPGSSTGSFTSNLSGLSPSTTYHIRAYATNSAGTAYGANVTFTTSEVVINGQCATPPDGSAYSTAPTGTLCSSGTASPSSLTGGGPWTWVCQGSGSGHTDDSCSASFKKKPIFIED